MQTMEDYVEWLDHPTRAFAKSTQGIYKSNLKQFLGFDDFAKVPSICEVERFLQAKRKKSASSAVMQALNAIKAYCEYLQIHSYPVDSKIFSYSSPSVWRGPELLTPAEVTQLLRAPDQSTDEGYCAYALFALLYLGALKPIEATHLNIFGIDKDSVLVATDKFKKRVPTSGSLHRAIQVQVDRVKSHNTYVFIDTYGYRIDATSCQVLLAAYGRQAGIAKKISPYSLRRAFIVHAQDAGASFELIMSLLGLTDNPETHKEHIALQTAHFSI